MNDRSAHTSDSLLASAVERESTVDGLPASTAVDASTGRVAGAPASRVQALPAVFGRYRIERMLGCGGMGSVYLAHDQQLSRPVALKVPRVAPHESNKLLARLKREALSVAALNHPNICPVYDAGEIDGIHYLAMAFIKGRSLTEYLKSGKPQSERAAALTVLKIAKALEEAHRQGILHRDLKPGNIMIDSRGEPIVMDFGLACRLDDDQQTRLTQEGMMVGTPAYMSPEQIDRRSPVGLTSDIYSLGVVLYELLTQRCPFEGSVVSIVGQILHGEPPPIESRRENVSPELARLCRKAMSKNAAERFGSMQEFADALTAFVRGKQSATTGAKTLPDVPAEKQELLTPPLASPLQTTTVPRWRGFDFSPRLVGIVVTSAAAVLLVIGLAIFASRANRPTFAASNPNTTASAATPPALPPTAAPAATESAMPVVRSTSRELPPPPGAPLRLEDFRGKPVEENFKRLDRNGDGLITPSEAPLHIIRRADSNYDEAIDLPEMLDAFALLHEGLFAPPTDAERERLPAHFGGPEPRPRPGPPPGPRPGPPPGPPPGQGRPPPPRGPAPRQP